jgi:oligosaccharide repeat unit polymerase
MRLASVIDPASNRAGKAESAAEKARIYTSSPDAAAMLPVASATCVLLVGLLITGLAAGGDTPSALAHYAAIGVGLSIGTSIWIEVWRGSHNALRADLVAMVAFYFLTFLEFLFPQPRLDGMNLSMEELTAAIRLCLWCLAAMALGRHCVSSRGRHWRFLELELRPTVILSLFWGSFALGYFYMLMAVNFNPIEMVSCFLEPRFAAPWGRGRFGDANALLYELGATLYLVPAIAGVILGRRNSYGFLNLILVSLALLFTLFYGFTTGTRNVIATYLITFLVAYFYASSRSRREALVLFGLAVAILALSTIYGIRFRDVGLKHYLQGFDERPADVEQGVYVDYNLYVISQLITIFPEHEDYVGWKLPLWLLARPIPRALWPGKPDGADVSAENILGREDLTVASTFIGESYMAAGIVGSVIAAFLLGFLAQWWTKNAFCTSSDFGILIYGSGFFAVVITMRSLYWLPVALLPTVAAVVMGWCLSQHSVARRPATEEPTR